MDICLHRTSKQHTHKHIDYIYIVIDKIEKTGRKIERETDRQTDRQTERGGGGGEGGVGGNINLLIQNRVII